MPTHPTVLVTGASSGIGAATALKLAREGWRVFAGVRRLDSAPAGVPGIVPLALDVSNGESVAKAAGELRESLGGQGLNALVNNAGIGQIAPMEYVTPEQIRGIFDVNVFGLVAVTQAVLPLLRVAKGRIINLSSVGGLLTIPFGGGLCATKHAVEAISEAFRMELMSAGIEVVVIRPASIHSPAADKLAAETEQVLARFSPEARSRYEASIRSFVPQMQAQENAGSSPEVVADTIFKALTAEKPHAHYFTGKDATMMKLLGEWVPERLREQLILKKLGLPDRPE